MLLPKGGLPAGVAGVVQDPGGEPALPIAPRGPTAGHLSFQASTGQVTRGFNTCGRQVNSQSAGRKSSVGHGCKGLDQEFKIGNYQSDDEGQYGRRVE